MFFLMHAIVLITNKCNLKCPFCSARWLKEGKETLNKQEIVSLLHELADMKTMSVAFVGGEPLLSPDLNTYIKEATSLQMSCALSTNGSLITENKICELKDAGLKRIQFSLDGPAKIHDAVRGETGLFNKIVKAITYCQKVDLPSNIMFTVSDFNVDYIEEIVELAEQMGVQLFIERMIGKKDSTFQKKYLSKMLELTEKENYNKLIFSNDPIIELKRKKSIFPSKGVYGGCTAGVFSCTISAYGDIYACPNLPIPLGNIREQSLNQIWEQSILLNKFRNRDFLEQSKCANCDSKKSCAGCRADAYYTNLTPYGEDPLCDMLI